MMDRLADRKVQRDDEALENRGVYEEYDDEEEGEFEDEGAEEVRPVFYTKDVCNNEPDSLQLLLTIVVGIMR
jgi:hypothetical protein